MKKILSIRNLNFLVEGAVRLFLLWLFVELERKEPFIRVIHAEELWMYRHPRTDSYVPSQMLWNMVAFLPPAATVINFLFQRSKDDLLSAMQVITLAIPLNGVITDIIKLTVGRPRPDFVFRCWPDGNVPAPDLITFPLTCSGDPATIIEGRKSFPSGHSSFSFACWGFVFLYVSGKLGTFCGGSKTSSSLKLLLSISLLIAPLTIAISRTADYHHHWQDVCVGSLLGFSIVWTVYLQYYPSISSANSHIPLGQASVKIRNSSKGNFPNYAKIEEHGFV
jgi:membrane-associated phospholipid phosphatase